MKQNNFLEQRQNRIATKTFVLVGAIIWVICGCNASMAALLFNKGDINLDDQEQFHAVVRTFFESIAIWGVSGIVMGLSLRNLYITRPPEEHFQATQWILPGRPNPGPKTVAEMKAGFYGIITGIMFGVVLAFLPSLFLWHDTSGVAFKGILFSIVCAAIATVTTLKIALWRLSKIAIREQW